MRRSCGQEEGYSGPVQARTVALDELTSKDLAAWSECAALSLEPNPFFEPDWLLPAVEYLNESPATRLVLTEQRGAIQACVPVVEVTADGDTSRALRRHSAVKTRVTPTAVLLGTPLVTVEGGSEALACLITEIRHEAERRGATLVIMEWVACGGPVDRLLKGVALGRDSSLVEFDVWERGLLRRQAAGGECYWLRGIGKNRRRTIRQHRQHLREVLGASPVLRVRDDVGAVDEFMQLEASGWKGHEPEGLALGREVRATSFFETVCDRYIKEGRMYFLSLEGNEVPIAMICCVRAGEGLFAYRTAYDEKLAKYGPGVEVFLAAMEHFDRETDACWFDTCAVRDNQHLLGLFPDRRTMATVMFRVPGRSAVAL